MHAAKKIFNSSIYPYQIQLSTISKGLVEFFKKDQHNTIEFWDCPSCKNWTLHCFVDRETKKFDLVPILPCKSLWNFDRKNKCVSGTVHTGVEVHRMDLEMSGLVERPWLQLMCCAVCLPCGHNFR